MLAFTSCCNLAWLPGIHTFQPFHQLNLTKLRELKLIGKNLRSYQHELSEVYHNSLQHLLKTLSENENVTLKKLEILTDNTLRSVDTAGMINGLVNLEELVLHGIGHFNDSASYAIDAQIANPIIQSALLNRNISVLRLVKFQFGTESETLMVHSETLKQLSVTECKFIKLDLVLPALTTLETELRIPMNSPMIDQFLDKKMVERNCPLLCTWNRVNVKEVVKKAGSSNWAEHLTFPEADYD